MKIINWAIEDIDGCEFVKSSKVGNILISFEKDIDGSLTDKICVVYPDGSSTSISKKTAQKKLDSDEWIIIR